MIADTSSPMHTGWEIFAADIADDIIIVFFNFSILLLFFLMSIQVMENIQENFHYS